MNAEKIREKFAHYAAMTRDVPVVPPGYRGALIGTLEKACRGPENRRLVLKYLCGKTTSKELSPAEWYALSRFVDATTDATGHWVSNHGIKFDDMVGAILAEVVKQDGQMEFANV